MTDFDRRLRSRLERLDAAIPVRPWSGMAPETPRLGPSMKLGRRGRLVLLLAAAAAIASVSTAAAVGLFDDEATPPEVEAAVADVFAATECVSADQARETLRGKLDAAGFTDWPIESRQFRSAGLSANQARCAVPVIIDGRVALFPAPGADVLDAMEVVAEELLDGCYTREEATQLVIAALAAHGVSGWKVSGDVWGPQVFPSSQEEQYRQHVADGCVVYAGMPFGPGELFLWGGRWPWE